MKLLALLLVAGVAYADPAPDRLRTPSGSAARPGEAGACDPRAQEAGNEANLESNAPRAGVTVSGALGGSLFLGSGSVGKGGALTLRLGHVMTRTTVLQFELAGGSFFHSAGKGAPTVHDDDANLLAGAQWYTSPSLWLRAGAGVGFYTHNEQLTSSSPVMTTHEPGLAGVVGIGVDLVRRHYWVLGMEAFAVAKLRSVDGFLAMSGLCLGLSYY